MSKRMALFAFLLIAAGGGLAIGFVTAPGAWYAALAKPSFNPPNWIFAPVWTILYILIAVAGWRTWMRAPHGAAMKLWTAQLALNFLWSPVFFVGHWPSAALVVIVLLLAAVIAFIAVSMSKDRVAAWLFVPYAFWVAFASLLNASIRWLN